MATLCYYMNSKIDDRSVEYMEQSFIPIEEAQAKADYYNAHRTDDQIEDGLKYFVLKGNYTKEEFYY